MYFLQFSSVTSAVNNVYNLVTWKGSRKNLEWTCMDNIDHASRNRLSSSSMRRAAAASAWRNERTYNTHATNESFFVQENMAKQSDQQSTRCRNKSRDLCRSLTISDGLWRSLTISGDLWRSLTISWDSFERMVPLRSVAPPLGVSLSRGIRPSRLEHSWMRIFANVNAATCCDQPSHLQPPLSMFANMKWHRNGFKQLALQYWNQAECKKILAASLRYQLLRNLLRTGSHKNGLQLLHSSPCDLAIVPNAVSVSNPKLLMQVAPWIQSKLGSTWSCMLEEKNDTSCYIKLSKPAVQACRTDFVFVWQHFFKYVLETSGKGWYQALNWTVPTQKATWWAPWSTGISHI